MGRTVSAPQTGTKRRVAWRIVVLGLALAALLSGVGCTRSEPAAPAPSALPDATAPSSATAPSVAGGSATATPSAAVASESAQTARPVVTIGWVGDTTPGSKYGMPPQEGRALYADVRDKLQAPDIMASNLEGTFGSGGKSKSSSGKSYSFQAPPSYANALAWAGFDVVSLANNHAHDYLEAGMASTEKALDDAGVAYTGQPGQITVVERNGVKVAFIGAAPYRWSQSLKDVSGTAALVRKAKKQADVVIVLMHAGAEGSDKIHTPQGAEQAYGEFRGASREFAHAMIDAGASAVLGSGPHVIRGVEQYRGGLVAYSLGNFAGWGNFSTAGNLALSGLLSFQVDGDGRVLGGSWLPLRVAGSGVPQPDPKAASLALVRKLSAADFESPWPIGTDGSLAPAP